MHKKKQKPRALGKRKIMNVFPTHLALITYETLPSKVAEGDMINRTQAVNSGHARKNLLEEQLYCQHHDTPDPS